MTHAFQCRVYYEDTDLAGIVYYANYLKFIERARSEFVRDQGIDQTRAKAEEGVVFAVRRIEADYLRPAKFDDLITILTTPLNATPAQITLSQDVMRGDEVLFKSKVVLVALKADGRPTRLPAKLRELAP